jgi:aquaporin Z
MLVVGRIAPPRAVQYILAQLAGASLAAWACVCFFPREAVNAANLGIPLPGPLPGQEGAWVTVPILLGVEFVLTFMLMTAIFGTAVDTRGAGVKIGGFGVGLTVAFDILACGKVTGASMNPARSFGPALIHKLTGGEAGAQAFDLHWCYWLAPVAGAIVAALIYEHLILAPDDDR